MKAVFKQAADITGNNELSVENVNDKFKFDVYDTENDNNYGSIVLDFNEVSELINFLKQKMEV